MQDLSLLHSANFVVGEGEDGYGFPVSGDKFHLIRIAAGIPVDDGANVAPFQTVSLKVMQQNRRVHLFDSCLCSHYL